MLLPRGQPDRINHVLEDHIAELDAIYQFLRQPMLAFQLRRLLIQ